MVTHQYEAVTEYLDNNLINLLKLSCFDISIEMLVVFENFFSEDSLMSASISQLIIEIQSTEDNF